MGDAFAAWQATAAIWSDGLHRGLLGVLTAAAGLLVAWHAVRALYGALTGNAKRELIQALWQLGLLGIVYQVIANPVPVWNGTLGVVGGVYRLAAAPFLG